MKNRKRSDQSDPVLALSDEDGRRAGNELRKVVRTQIRTKTPPVVEATYARLLRSGQDRRNAIELITAVLVAEIYDMMSERRPYDEAKYTAMLKRLPELPYESDA
jgi:predicted nucleic acid-binding protein